MSEHESQSYRFAELYGHSFDHVDNSWLHTLGVCDAAVLETILANRRAYRSLLLSFIDYYQVIPAPTEELPPRERWVLRGSTFLHALALRLGLFANADFVRTSVTREAREALHRTLDAAAYRQTVEACTKADPLQVPSLTRSGFDASVRSGNIKSYLNSVGRRLLEYALLDAGKFAQQRLQFAFPADGDIAAFEPPADNTQLSRTIARLEGEL